MFAAHASLAKFVAADAAVEVFRLAIELRGSYGVQSDARLGAWLGDALCAEIAGGTREMHKRAIFDHLWLEHTRARPPGASAKDHTRTRTRHPVERPESIRDPSRIRSSYRNGHG